MKFIFEVPELFGKIYNKSPKMITFLLESVLLISLVQLFPALGTIRALLALVVIEALLLYFRQVKLMVEKATTVSYIVGAVIGALFAMFMMGHQVLMGEFDPMLRLVLMFTNIISVSRLLAVPLTYLIRFAVRTDGYIPSILQSALCVRAVVYLVYIPPAGRICGKQAGYAVWSASVPV